jgi:hypothetical protein
VFVTRGALEPGDRRRAFLGRDAPAGGAGETRPRRLEHLEIPDRRRQIGLGHPADRPPAHPEQVANPLLRTVGAGEQRPHRELAPGARRGRLGLVDALHVLPPEIRHVEIVAAMQRPHDLERRASDGPQIHADQASPGVSLERVPRRRSRLMGPLMES